MGDYLPSPAQMLHGALGGRRFRLPARPFKTSGGFPILRTAARFGPASAQREPATKSVAFGAVASQTSPDELK